MPQHLTTLFSLPQSVNASVMTVPNGKTHPRALLVAGLKLYTEYHFSVRMRPSMAQSEELWSPPAKLDVRTLSSGEWGGGGGGEGGVFIALRCLLVMWTTRFVPV